MKRIDSDALGLLQKSLGLSGRGSQITELTDGIVDQSLAINEVVRRGRTQAGTEGVYTAALRTIHGAADSQQAFDTPYDISVGAIPPYPNPTPTQFDIWLLAVTARQISGTGTISAILDLRYPTAQQGWGVDSAGTAVVSQAQMVLAFWDTLATEVIEFAFHGGISGPWINLGLRLPRSPNTQLAFRTTSSAIATFQCDLILGVFPVALGQDVLV